MSPEKSLTRPGANHDLSRPWNDESLGRAYDVLLEELDLPPSAPGGKVEFRRSLTLSFLFRFNLEVLEKLGDTVGDARPRRFDVPNRTNRVLRFLPERHHRQTSREDRASALRDPVQPAGVPGQDLLDQSIPAALIKARFPSPPQPVSGDQGEQDPVGRPIMHRSALSQATGEAVYCDDLPVTDGELFVAVVTSSRAHATIT